MNHPIQDEDLHEVAEAPSVDVTETGVPEVDEVLARMASSTDRPLAEQVQVLEEAHATLRRALG